MRAYLLALGLLLFQLSVPIAAALGYAGPITGENVPAEIGGQAITTTNWSGLVLASTGFVAGIASVVFRIPAGATVFAFVFAFANLPFASTMSSLVSLGYLIQPVADLINGALVFVFIFGFIQLASSGGKGGY